MRWLWVAAIFFVGLIGDARAQPVEVGQSRLAVEGLRRPSWEPGRASYASSVAALVAANALDIHSSYGKYEVNPVVAGSGGRFTGRSVAVKSGIVAGTLLVQWLIVRKHPDWKAKLAWLNWGTAGMYSGVALRNYTVPRPGTP
jgi:hypothetical protein